MVRTRQRKAASLSTGLFIFHVLSTDLCRYILIEWLGSMVDVVNLDSACSNADQRTIFHQTLAGMKAVGQLDKLSAVAHYRWLFERGMTIVAVTLHPKFLHRVGDILPVFREATSLTFADPFNGENKRDYADPTTAQLQDLMDACPKLASVSVELTSFNQLPHMLQLIADTTSGCQISSMKCSARCFADNAKAFLKQVQHLVTTTAQRGHLKHLHIAIADKLTVPILTTISSHCCSLLSLSLGDMIVDPKPFATMLSHLTVLERLEVVYFPLPKALPDCNQYVMSLLAHLPNLTVFATCDFDRFDYSLFVTMLQKWPQMRTFRVYMWITYRINTHGGYDLRIVQSHRSLELLMDLPLPGPVHSLKLCYQHISHPHVFSHLLDRFGPSLVELVFLKRYHYLRDALGTVHEEDSYARLVIAAKCPHLTHLKCGSLEGEPNQDKERCAATMALIADTYGPRLKSLKFAIIGGNFMISVQSFWHIAQNCTNLEEIAVTRCCGFTAQAIEQLLQHCCKLRVLVKQHGPISCSMVCKSILKWRRDRPFQFFVANDEDTESIKNGIDAAFKKAPLTGMKNSWKDFKFEIDDLEDNL